MLLILTLLAVFLSNTNAAFLDFLFGHKNTTIVVMDEPDVNKTFVQLNRKWKNRLTWDAKIAKEALKEAKELYSGKADFVVRKKKWLDSSERNETTMAQKVEGAMVNKFRKAEMFVSHSFRNYYFSCNKHRITWHGMVYGMLLSYPSMLLPEPFRDSTAGYDNFKVGRCFVSCPQKQCSSVESSVKCYKVRIKGVLGQPSDLTVNKAMNTVYV